MSQDIRERVLEAAGELFAERGYRAVTVREICRYARVNISAVNYYFRDKFTLYLEAVRAAARQCTRDVPMVTWSPTDLPSEKLRQFIANMLRRVVRDQEPTWPAQLILAEIVRPTRACRRFVREFVRPNFQILLEILREFLPKRCPAPILYRLAFSIVGQCLYYRLCRSIMSLLLGKEAQALLDIDTLTAHISNFSLAGIRAIRSSMRASSPRRLALSKPKEQS